MGPMTKVTCDPQVQRMRKTSREQFLFVSKCFRLEVLRIHRFHPNRPLFVLSHKFHWVTPYPLFPKPPHQFPQTQIPGTKFPESNFAMAKFSQAEIAQAKHTKVKFARATFADAIFAKATFEKATFVNTRNS